MGDSHMQERISPTTDLAFKKVLGSEENIDILAGFIEDFFEIKPKNIIIEKPYNIAVCKEHMENKEVSILRETLKDVAASFETADFITELQVRKTSHYEERSLYYPMSRFVQNYSRVEAMKTNGSGQPIRYSSLRPVYSMNILGYELFAEDEEALRIFELYDPKRSKGFIKNLLRIGYFELSKKKLETTNQKHWHDYFNTGKVDPKAPLHIIKASKIIEYVNLTEEERNMSFTLERLEANEEAERYYLFTEGKAEGIEIGIQKGEQSGIQKGEKKGIQKGEQIGIQKGEKIGIQKGEKKGRAEERAKAEAAKTESIKNLIEIGLSDKQISKAMQITENAVRKLRT
jgi:predicted transposase/invertase (TIGR01784 family)